MRSDPASTVEANFDGLVGPTHNYGGLAAGNLASAKNAGLVSAPRQAVLEGLEKMRRLVRAGFVQGVLPPQERPLIAPLRALGYAGSDAAVWEAAWRDDPVLCRNLASASSMWAANAATVSPSADARDGRLHFTPANLLSSQHRCVEADGTHAALGALFPDRQRFAVHDPLPAQTAFPDEGAANHVRLCARQGEPGVELFVYGRDAFEPWEARFPARQTRQASEAVARRHGLDPDRVVFARQARRAIEAGAFHNDVVCVGTGPVLFHHEHAFEDREGVYAAVRAAAEGLFEPIFVEVPEAEAPLEDAITSYLFNSQLLEWPGEDRLVLLAPKETEETESTRAYCERLVQSNGPIGRVEFADVRQSMRNGGGPACLRLRVVLTAEERAAVNPAALMDEARLDRLADWAQRRYRETLSPDDLGDPALLEESRAALDELTGLLDLGSDFYPFQRAGA